MITTPRMKTTITRNRSGLFSVVEIEHEGRKCRTTMAADVKASDLQVENLKRRLAHLPQIKGAA